MTQTQTAPINGFGGQYRFLSNFFDRFFTIQAAPGSPAAHLSGLVVPTAEHAFQAAKTFGSSDVLSMTQASSPGRAKQLGRRVPLRPDWEDVKDRVMEDILRSKFSDPELGEWLVATGDAELVETNHWHDTVWGVCGCSRHRLTGSNRLGRALMKIRAELAAASPSQYVITARTEAVAEIIALEIAERSEDVSIETVFSMEMVQRMVLAPGVDELTAMAALISTRIETDTTSDNELRKAERAVGSVLAGQFGATVLIRDI